MLKRNVCEKERKVQNAHFISVFHLREKNAYVCVFRDRTFSAGSIPISFAVLNAAAVRLRSSCNMRANVCVSG